MKPFKTANVLNIVRSNVFNKTHFVFLAITRFIATTIYNNRFRNNCTIELWLDDVFKDYLERNFKDFEKIWNESLNRNDNFVIEYCNWFKFRSICFAYSIVENPLDEESLKFIDSLGQVIEEEFEQFNANGINYARSFCDIGDNCVYFDHDVFFNEMGLDYITYKK